MTGRKEPVCYQGTIYKSFTDACKQLKVPYRTFMYYQLYIMISRGVAPAEAVRRLKQTKESKSVRMTLLFRPSIQESLKRIAEKENTSINSLVCAAVESFIEGHERVEKC